MNKFKVGDDIVRVDNPEAWAPIGYKVKVLGGYLYISHSGVRVGIVDSDWALIEPKYPNEPHVHCAEIIEWAKGADIERWRTVKWGPASDPSWRTDVKYRVKPPEQTELEKLEAQAIKLADYIAFLKGNSNGN